MTKLIGATEGRLFEYAPRLMAFEYGSLNSANVLIFIGGLGDGFLTVPYIPLLSSKLNAIGWSLIQIQLTSSYIGWGTGSLQRDDSEIAQLVDYLRSSSTACGGRSKIGLMGHSTGCQNTLHYLSKPGAENKTKPEIDFGILQASVSDREAITMLFPADLLEKSIDYAQNLIQSGNPNELMPLKYTANFFPAPINASRWISLATERGYDDFFSSYLNETDFKSTFGNVKKPLLVLYSGSDEFVPDHVDKAGMLEKFSRAVSPEFWSPLSKLVVGGTHNLGPESGPNAQEDATSTAIEFIKSI
ncbi:hypothetical protein CANARDRAFT_29556 [[Candida] arabinofermentans NRRL YB-2248]|uniref:DUF1749-domain-containing protein n=1 Tax=[Candida] arabinofermentans NRRL YB-2248 TaxID=983967 RepID=A0A1E4SWC0_9ASCO|nr:hypothetical protein CANARDRAFT_29556 [[Candida] arabinofermentans NRRL YB-2248]